MYNTYRDDLNRRIKNPIEAINSIKGFGIISESIVDKVYDIFGRNSLLSMLYQVGAGPGETIANRLKEKYVKEEFEVLEALILLITELKEFYSIQIRTIEEDDKKFRFVIENHCFLRSSIKRRSKLDFGKAFCRVNKGYFETAFRLMLGRKIKKIEINYVENDEEKDACIEELVFYK
jgi:hypothetical protein